MNQIQNTPILRVEKISKSYGTLVANDQISFEVQRGHVHCLLGENGAGKSTLAKCVYGAAKPDSGSLISHHLEMPSGRGLAWSTSILYWLSQ